MAIPTADALRSPMSLMPYAKRLNILAYRGDEREPRELFVSGLQRRAVSTSAHQSEGDGHVRAMVTEIDKYRREQKRFYTTRVSRPIEEGKTEARLAGLSARNELTRADWVSSAEIRWQGGELASSSTVCVTRRFDAAPIFPVHGMPEVWIYAIHTDTGVPTRPFQERVGSPLTFVEEVGVRDVPGSHIVGGVRISRRYNHGNDFSLGMQFARTGDIIWNPANAGAVRDRRVDEWKRTFVATMRPYDDGAWHEVCVR